MEIIDAARNVMRRNGNFTQWINGYPEKSFMKESILKGENYVIVHENELVGTFDFILGDDPNYQIIENGKWLNEKPYGVVHRLASNGKIKGIATFCFEWCFRQHPNIRVDTHEDNVPMQRVLEKLNYQKCGIIYVSDGTPRLVFQKTI